MKEIVLVILFVLMLSQRALAQQPLNDWEERLCRHPRVEKLPTYLKSRCNDDDSFAKVFRKSGHIYPEDLEPIRLAIQLGMDPSIYNNKLLFKAIAYQELPILRILVSSGANLEVEYIGRTPLQWAIIYPFFEAVRLLISSGSSIEAPALHIAAVKGEIEIARMLIEAGANVNALGHVGPTTALHLVVGYNEWESWEHIIRRVELCELLIRNGADVDIENSNGETAHQVAQKHSHWMIRNCTNTDLRN